MGIPLALQHVIIVAGGMVLQSTINGQGFLFVAGFTAANKLVGLMESSALSFGYAATTLYGPELWGRSVQQDQKRHEKRDPDRYPAFCCSVCDHAAGRRTYAAAVYFFFGW